MSPDRPAEFAAWVESVGKATTRLASENGFGSRTIEAAVRRRLVRVEARPLRSPPFGSYFVYFPPDR